MSSEENYIEINKESWNNRTDVHINSEFYDVEGFMKGKSSLNTIELSLLGDVKDKSILHLQCHFGQESISLSRLGAKVTGVDLSDRAIENAIRIAKETNQDTQFVCCDIYDLTNHLNEQFDIVYTSYGTIGWLPNMDKWASVISKFLKPEGKFVFVEFHPVIWMFDENYEEIKYNYFNTEAIIEVSTGTYADKNAPIIQEEVSWNHNLAEVFTALIKTGLEIKQFEEFDYSPYKCFNKMIEFEPEKFRIAHLENKIPLVYSIVATKK